MVDVAKVIFSGVSMGVLYWDERHGVARFEYGRDFIGRGLEPSPLTMLVRDGR